MLVNKSLILHLVFLDDDDNKSDKTSEDFLVTLRITSHSLAVSNNNNKICKTNIQNSCQTIEEFESKLCNGVNMLLKSGFNIIQFLDF
mgnify:CR=1 FL=1